MKLTVSRKISTQRVVHCPQIPGLVLADNTTTTFGHVCCTLCKHLQKITLRTVYCGYSPLQEKEER